MLSYFYTRTEKTSHQQLLEDFGEFPPKPLVSRKLPYRFHLVRVRGPANLFNFYTLWMSALTALKQNPSSLSPAMQSALADVKEHVIGLTSTNINGTNDPSEFKIALPKQIAAAICAFGMWRKQRLRKRCHGYYLPIVTHEAQITVLGRATKRPKGIAPVVSHEHIHFLQHCDGNMSEKEAPGSAAYLKKEKVESAALLYLLEQKEVEARLHEVVLSAYRAGHQIPLTLHNFLSMLCACKQLTEFLTLICEASGFKVTCNGPFFETRDPDLAVDIEHVMTFAKNEDLTCRFAMEALPVMYGNLLRYYGDECASETFLTQIERPNLYDELYGLKAA
jgi:hypothetical protein